METLPNTPGIYQWRNTVNGYLYIGSARNLQHRKHTHLYEIRKGKHPNLHLLRAFREDGEQSFVFEVLETVDNTSLLVEREQYYLDALKPEYNFLLVAYSRSGIKHSEAARRKMSES